MKFLLNWFPKKEEVKYHTEEIFMTNGVPKYTFVKRDSIEKIIDKSIHLHNKLLIFSGYSKSGKTVYRKEYFKNKNIDQVLYRCSAKSTWEDLYKRICIDLNLPYKNSLTTGNNNSLFMSSTVKVGNNFAGAEGTAEYSEGLSSEESKLFPNTDIDVNYLCNLLSGKNILIILEDYHLVTSSFAKKLSEDLKHFLDEGIQFILIGIPSSPSRTLKNNPDLGGRTETINFDYLSIEEINEILDKGQAKLNIEFKKDVRRFIEDNSMHNAFLVQAITQKILLNKGIDKNTKENIIIHDKNEVTEACFSLAKDLHNDYKDIIEVIVTGQRKQKDTKFFNQYEEILLSIKETDIKQLEVGLQLGDIVNSTWNRISEEVKEKVVKNNTYQNRTTLKNSVSSSISIALTKIEENLEQSNSRKLILFNDGRLYLVDIVFKFYIMWNESLFKNDYKGKI